MLNNRILQGRFFVILMFLGAIAFVAGNLQAEQPPAKISGTRPTASPDINIEQQFQQLLALREKYQAQYQKTAANLDHMRVQMQSTGSGVFSPVTALERQIADDDHALQLAQDERRLAQHSLEDMHQAAAEKKESPGVRDAVRADPIVLELRRRLNETEIQLAIAAKSGAKKVDLEIERTVLVERLVAVRNQVSDEARINLTDDLTRQASRASVEQKRLEIVRDDNRRSLGEATNRLVTYFSLESEQKQNSELMKAVDAQLTALDATRPPTRQ